MLDELCAPYELEQSCSGNQPKAVMLTCQLANLCSGIAQSIICYEQCLYGSHCLYGPDALGNLNDLRKSL